MIVRCCTIICCVFFLFLFSHISGGKKQDKVFILQKENSDHPKSKLLVVTWQEKEGDFGGCEFFDDQNLIDEVLSSAPDSEIQMSSEEEMKDLLKECTQVSLRKKRQVYYQPSGYLNFNYRAQSSNSWRRSGKQRRSSTRNTTQSSIEMKGPRKEVTTEGYDGWNVIFPGTKWCGAGDIAKNYDDLGLHQDTDKCCRAHDLCNDTLAPGATRNNLTNNSPFTKLSCKCDQDFYDCLDRVNSMISNKIGNVYFNILKRDCYEADYPLTKKCKTFRSLLKITCKEYERNTKAPKVYQWKKPKVYKKLPFPGPITVTLPF